MDTDHGGAADEAEAAFFARRSRRCCCFPCWPSSSTTTTTSASLSHHRIGGAATTAAEEESWWQGGVDALLKVREWSELAAGPRWKTFIRRFGRGPGPRNNFGRKLNYDPLSYALNFDEGPGATPEHPGAAGDHRDFSSRFAAPPISAKSSMDLGGRDAPSLFSATPAGGPGRA